MNGKAVIARFDGGLLSSDSDVIALGEVEKRRGVARRLARCIDDPRRPEQIVHSLADMIGFRMKMIAAGYEDGNDATRLCADPIFKMAEGGAALGPGSRLAIDDLPAGEPARPALSADNGAGDGRFAPRRPGH